MYDLGTPIGGGVLAVGVLAATGAEPLPFILAGLGLAVGGLLLLRTRVIRAKAN